MANEKIMIVDDDSNICELIRIYLEKEKYSTVIANDGLEAINIFAEEKPNLILLDVMLPGMDGWQVCRKIRGMSNVPIIMLSAKGELFDKVLGLELGADDYMTKPFSIRELIARVKAILRRSQFTSKDEATGEVLTFGDLSIDIEKYEVRKRGDVIELTFREFELLKFLATKKGKIFSRENLLNKVWDYEFYGDVRTVDVTIRRLREKIEDNPSIPTYIMTKRGVGYYFGA